MDIRKVALIAILALVAIYLFASNLLWQLYSNEAYGFSIFLPRLWYKEEGFLGTAIMAKAPQTSRSDIFQENINVMVAEVPQDMNLPIYFQFNKNEVMEELPGDEFDVEEGEILAGKERGLWLSLSSKGTAMILRVISAVWMKGNRAYVVTCSGQESEFHKYEPIFKKALRSIRFK